MRISCKYYINLLTPIKFNDDLIKVILETRLCINDNFII